VGATQAFVATGTYEDGSKKDLSSKVTWSTTLATLATVSATGVVTGGARGKVTVQAEMGGKTGTIELTVAGVATAVAPGTVAIKATFEGKDSTVIIKVTTPAIVLSSLSVTAPFSTLATGASLSLVATGTYTDASKHIITEEVDWTTSSAAIATISGARGSLGTVTAVAKGTVTISASFAGKTGTTSLTVTEALLTAITVTPNKPVIADGTTLELHATCTFSDNSTKDLTSDVTWTTSNSTIATVSNAANSDGFVTGVAPGTVTITVSLSGKSHGAVIRVTDAVHASISLTPLDTSIAIGTTKQFKAIGIFTDALKVGQTVIRASLSGKSASTTLTVTAASLASITIVASPMTIAKGTTTQFIATE
jgi:hypothetical protein